MNEDSNFGNIPSHDHSFSDSHDYLSRAQYAAESGDRILGIHLYLAAFEQSILENIVPSEESVNGMRAAWDLAVDARQHSLAEYIFEKLKPFVSAEELSRKADQLQDVALDRLEEFGFSREAIEDMASGKGPWCAGIADEENFNKEECLKKVEAAYSGIKLELDMAKAFADADLLIESMAENEKDKIAFYEKMAPLLPEKTVVVTNSSTLLPSMFAKYTGRPEKYLSLHFANSIWKNNTAEIMAQPKTDEKYFNDILQFANDIRMIGLPVRKEKSGYLLNSMLVPFLLSGLDLYASGVSDPESIDIAWTHGTGAPKGPFRIFDTVGLNTAYNIVHQYQSVPGIFSPLLKKMMMPYNFKKMEEILKKYIDEGKLGMSSGEGFYKYK